MDWKAPAEKDAAVRAWMRSKGWVVDSYESDGRKQVHLWIHHRARGSPVVLGVSWEVLSDTPAFAIQELFHRLHLAAELRARPRVARVLVRRNDSYMLDEFVR